MKLTATIAIGLAILSILLSLWFVGENPKSRAQFLRLEFPIEFGESTLLMMLPIALSALALLAGLLTCIRKRGRVATATALLSWVVIWVILGQNGFGYYRCGPWTGQSGSYYRYDPARLAQTATDFGRMSLFGYG